MKVDVILKLHAPCTTNSTTEEYLVSLETVPFPGSCLTLCIPYHPQAAPDTAMATHSTQLGEVTVGVPPGASGRQVVCANHRLTCTILRTP